MNTRKLLAASIILMLSASVSLGAGGIVGSAHDFTNEGWADNEICKPCHTPHHAIAPEVSGRLWNHELSQATYTLHGARGAPSGSSATTDLTRTGGQEDIDGASRLCLSCHDGTVALDSFGGKTGDVMIATKREGRADLGTDLSNDHPIGIAAVYRPEFSPSPGHFSYNPTADVKAAGVRLASLGTTRVVSGSNVTNEVVSCISCHNPHGGNDPTTGQQTQMLLRVDNTSSKLCLTCHIK